MKPLVGESSASLSSSGPSIFAIFATDLLCVLENYLKLIHVTCVAHTLHRYVKQVMCLNKVQTT
jgi:hypothetical protein